ncbi:MAG: alpha/beta hydrolase [Magnetococcales bacterium]|nr:alpha/beta hydrolase [Magnetococcales bacterium]NGZ25611.1 alpha/beta hydrolase [Magnetococcales bacterium]
MKVLWLVHGWGFSPGFWRPLMAQLPGWRVVRADLGYYGPTSHLQPPEEPHIAMGHSLGFLHILRQLGGAGASCRGVVGINAFARFSRCENFPQGIHPRILERMMRQMSQQPGEVLQEFRHRSGWESGVEIPTSLQMESLLAGLRFLLEEDGRSLLKKIDHPLLILASQDDQIVPPSLTHASFPAPMDLRWHKEGGHVLPLLHPQWCSEQLLDWLQHLI